MVRAPQPDDADAVLAVWVARDVVDTGEPDYTLEDVVADFTTPGVDCWVAERDAGVLGVAVLDDRGGQVAIHPEREGRGAEAALCDALETRARERAMDVVRQHVSARNAGWRDFLSSRGYAPAFHYVRMRAPREDLPSEVPELPGRRPFVPGDDDRVAYAVVRDAFADIPGNVEVSYEQFRAEVLDRSLFAADRSWVVEDPHGVVGVVLCERREGGMGYVGDVAVLRRGRGRGIGRGLLQTALAGFRGEGATAGELWVNGANAPALGLYESVGLREIGHQERWEKSLGD